MFFDSLKPRRKVTCSSPFFKQQNSRGSGHANCYFNKLAPNLWVACMLLVTIKGWFRSQLAVQIKSMIYLASRSHPPWRWAAYCIYPLRPYLPFMPLVCMGEVRVCAKGLISFCISMTSPSQQSFAHERIIKINYIAVGLSSRILLLSFDWMMSQGFP